MLSVGRPSAISFSFIIPVRNEVDDIANAIATVERAARSYASAEIVAIDDASTDGTRELLRQYAEQGRIRLVEHAAQCGAATARNSGMEVASGDIVVFMDADNVISSDFVERLHGHYADGADFVTVQSEVVNQTGIVGRFQQASHALAYGGLRGVTYSQSFSCRRALAMSVRFREDLVGSEDGDFFNRLPVSSGRWIRDESIVVGHRVPDTVAAIWRQSAWRGRNTVVRHQRTRETPLSLLMLRQVAVLIFWTLAVLSVAPAIVAGYRRARQCELHARTLDVVSFAGVWAVQVLARRIGEWRGLIYLAGTKGQSGR